MLSKHYLALEGELYLSLFISPYTRDDKEAQCRLEYTIDLQSNGSIKSITLAYPIKIGNDFRIRHEPPLFPHSLPLEKGIDYFQAKQDVTALLMSALRGHCRELFPGDPILNRVKVKSVRIEGLPPDLDPPERGR